MSKQFRTSLKSVWFAVNGILLLVSIVSWMVGAENVFGICGTLLLLSSYPFNLLFVWLFFAFGDFSTLPGAMLLMLLGSSVIGYLQWFVFVPRITTFIKRKLFSRDLKVSLIVNLENTRQIAEPNLEDSTQNWRTNWYNEHKHTPVERVFNHDLN